MPKESVPRGLALFGKRLLKARKAAGLTQNETAEKIGYSRHVVSHAESGQQPPSREVAVALDGLFGTVDLFSDLWDDMAQDRRPGWVLALIEAEARATVIRAFQPNLIPGLLQTEDYARAVLNQGRITNAADDEINERVTTRLQRQEILSNGQLHIYQAIIDEAALHRTIGSPAIMRGALDHLLGMMRSHRIEVQVLPYSVGAHPGDCGPFVILDLDGGTTVVHLDGPAGGTTTSEPGTVEDCRQRFDGLRAQALSIRESAELIARRMKELEQ